MRQTQQHGTFSSNYRTMACNKALTYHIGQWCGVDRIMPWSSNTWYATMPVTNWYASTYHFILGQWHATGSWPTTLGNDAASTAPCLDHQTLGTKQCQWQNWYASTYHFILGQWHATGPWPTTLGNDAVLTASCLDHRTLGTKQCQWQIDLHQPINIESR